MERIFIGGRGSTNSNRQGICVQPGPDDCKAEGERSSMEEGHCCEH